MTAAHIPVCTVKNYYPDDLRVIIRRDSQRPGWAFIASPSHFCVDAEQLRQLADALHGMADALDGDNE